MKKVPVPFIITLLVIPVMLAILFILKLVPTETTYKTVRIGNTTIRAEVADTLQKQTEGLIGRNSLSSNNGMLFIFNTENYPGIWMFNMSFPIDIIWINKDMKITDIVQDAKPCMLNCTTYLPSEKSLYVLEVNSGFTTKNKIKVGNTVSIS
ncbi:MAG: DUF192 domain-containing protein [Candidatus Aenigmarchaeota archaeon]|nr:DUF192 domain-containing protein [Candidatus Aenigmarchaeota archaeon]